MTSNGVIDDVLVKDRLREGTTLIVIFERAPIHGPARLPDGWGCGTLPSPVDPALQQLYRWVPRPVRGP